MGSLPPLLLLLLLPVACSSAQAGGRPIIGSGIIPDGQGIEVFGYCWTEQQSASHPHVPSAPCHYPMLNSTGVGWVRNQLHWSHIETTRSAYNFSLQTTTADTSVGPEDYDSFVLGMKADGVKVLFILGGCGPDCANPLYPGVETPQGRAAFTRFAVAAAQHFDSLYPGGVAYELWNEPLMGSWAKDTNTTPGYNKPVPLFNSLALAVGSGLQGAKLPTPPALLAPGATLMSNDAFLSDFAQSGVLRYLAGFSVHPYRDCQWPERALLDWQRLRSILDRVAAGRDVPMVSSEWGYSALWPTPAMKKLADPRFDQPAVSGCDEELQGKFLREFRTRCVLLSSVSFHG